MSRPVRDARPRQWLKPVIVAALIATLVAIMGMLATDVGSWYHTLRKPVWQPPDWLFGPAWTIIFALAALAGAAAWRNTRDRNAHTTILGVFAFNAFWNVLWSLLFFRLQRPDFALAEVSLLWASVVLLIVVMRVHSRLAFWLLLPYLAWVTFAAVLNLAVVRLNGPF